MSMRSEVERLWKAGAGDEIRTRNPDKVLRRVSNEAFDKWRIPDERSGLDISLLGNFREVVVARSKSDGTSQFWHFTSSRHTSRCELPKDPASCVVPLLAKAVCPSRQSGPITKSRLIPKPGY